MVIFDFKEEETETEHVAIATCSVSVNKVWRECQKFVLYCNIKMCTIWYIS